MRPRLLGVPLTICLLLGACTSDAGSSESSTTTRSAEETTSPSVSSTPAITDPGPDFGDIGSVPADAEGESTGPLGSTQIRVDTGAGTVQIGAGSVPERLGSEFPLPPDLAIELASETSSDLGFSGTTDLSFAELVELYEVGLPAAGYVVVSVDQRGEQFAVFEFSSGAGIGQVAIAEAPGPAAYTLIVTFGDGVGEEAQLGN